jgi:anti-sigma-K factor RskA
MESKEYIASGIIEQYVLGLCSAEECTTIEMRRNNDEALDAAITAFEIELENKYLVDATMPSKEADNKILAQLNALSKTSTEKPIIKEAVVRKMNGWKIAAAASVALLIGSGVYNYIAFNKIKEQEATIAYANKPTNNTVTLPATDYAVITNPAITPVAMLGQGYHAICRCTLYWDKTTGKAYVMIHHLPKSGDESNFQLWAMVNNKPVNIGVVNDAIRGRFIEMPNVPSDASGFSVTLENAATVATTPSTDIYLKGTV